MGLTGYRTAGRIPFDIKDYSKGIVVYIEAFAVCFKRMKSRCGVIFLDSHRRTLGGPPEMSACSAQVRRAPGPISDELMMGYHVFTLIYYAHKISHRKAATVTP